MRDLKLPVQTFLRHPVLLKSICYRTKAKWLINESNKTRGLQKIWTGQWCPHHDESCLLAASCIIKKQQSTPCSSQMVGIKWFCPIANWFCHPSNFFSGIQSYCSRVSVGLLSYDSRLTLIRMDQRWKFWPLFSIYSSLFTSFCHHGNYLNYYHFCFIAKVVLWSPSGLLYSTKFFLRSGCTRVDLLSYDRKPTDKRDQYDWMTEKKLDGYLTFPSPFPSREFRTPGVVSGSRCWGLLRAWHRGRSERPPGGWGWAPPSRGKRPPPSPSEKRQLSWKQKTGENEINR